MIAVFLRAELDSDRYGETLRGFLARDGRDEDVLRRPDLGDVADNGYRRQLLEEHRAYERRDGVFGGFPRRVDWFRAALEPEEVLDILYIDWDWWLRITGGTRSPRDAARRMHAGEIPGADVEWHRAIAARLQSDDPPPELIAVKTPTGPLVLVEGHVRLTAYAVAPEYLPERLELYVGIGDAAADWPEY